MQFESVVYGKFHSVIMNITTVDADVAFGVFVLLDTDRFWINLHLYVIIVLCIETVNIFSVRIEPVSSIEWFFVLYEYLIFIDFYYHTLVLFFFKPKYRPALS